MPGETGLLVNSSDSSALAAAMDSFLDDTAFAERAGKAGIVFAQEHFDAVKNTRRVIELYEQLLAGKAG